jgi:hypothetical protein
MIKYALTSQNFEGEVIFTYNDLQLLIGYDNQSNMTEKQLIWLLEFLPRQLCDLTILPTKSKTLFLREIPIELTFDLFWDSYNYKVDKFEAQKVWDKLSRKEKLESFEYIKKYKTQCASSGVAIKYAKTYLRQKPWIN